jgi:hypothetical protein
MNRETGWRSKRDLNSRPLVQFSWRNCRPVWLGIPGKIKATVLQRYHSPRIRFGLRASGDGALLLEPREREVERSPSIVSRLSRSLSELCAFATTSRMVARLEFNAGALQRIVCYPLPLLTPSLVAQIIPWLLHLLQRMHRWRSERSPPAENVPCKTKISHRPSAFANQDLSCQSVHSPEKGLISRRH